VAEHAPPPPAPRVLFELRYDRVHQYPSLASDKKHDRNNEPETIYDLNKT
jgi:hypothetical protein